MAKKIKLVYDWFGPHGPMINNHPPTLYQLSRAVDASVSTGKFFEPYASSQIFSHITGYEFVPSFRITDKDTFIYEFAMNWQTHWDMAFGVGCGILDQSRLSRHLLHQIKYGNGYILIEYVCEAFYTSYQLRVMHRYFANYQIPLRKIIYMVGSPNASEMYARFCDSEGIAPDNRMTLIFVDFVEWHLAKRLTRQDQVVVYPNGQTFDLIEKDFLVLNRRLRQQRRNLTMMWHKLGLLDKSFYSCPDVEVDNGVIKFSEACDPNWCQFYGVTTDDINSLQNLLPLNFDGITDSDEMTQDSGNLMTSWYAKSLISVVTETNFYENEITRTEKTYKPIRYKHPFILAGVVDGLKYLKKQGYKTFNQFWSERYDDLIEPNVRLKAIGDICVEISNWSQDQKREFFVESRKIVEHNHDVLANSYPMNNSMKFWISFRNQFGTSETYKRALVCGGAGFIGCHLVSYLKTQGYYVVSVDMIDPPVDKNDADEFIKCDLRDEEKVEMLLAMNFDEVYQLAADMGGAGFIFTGDNDNEIMHNNTMINMNIIKAAQNNPAGRIFYSSSACVYPQENQRDPQSPVCVEHTAYPANPDSEYGWEKLYSERLYLTAARTKGMTVRIARLHNVFGPFGAWNNGREKAPAALCRKIAMTDNNIIDIWGDGQQTRSFLYIDECVKGIYKIMHSDLSVPVNLGSEQMITIDNLAGMIAMYAGKNISINHIDGPTGVRGRTSDNLLLEQATGWRPKENLEEGLKTLYTWIQQQLEKGA